MPEVLIFDGDDTLWVTEPLYDVARRRAAALVEAAGFDAVEWDAHQRTIDVANVARFGMGPLRFPTSCVEALDAVAAAQGMEVPGSLRMAVGDAASSVFRAVAPLVEGVESILIGLRGAFRLALLTKGDEAVQRKRVADSGLAHLFDLVHIVPDKDAACFAAVRDELGSSGPGWSIGNSLSSDIGPALEAGMQAIWVDAHVWEYERRTGKAPNGVWIADRLADVPAILRRAADAQGVASAQDGSAGTSP